MKSVSAGEASAILSPKAGTPPPPARPVQRQVFLDQHADHAQRMAAQRERVLVAGGQVADAEHAHQRLQLVGQRHHHAHRVARQLVAGKARLVVVFDGEGDVFGQAVVARVVAAHDALQLGELAHHVGQQVGLGQRAAVSAACARVSPPSCWPMARAMARTRAPCARPGCPACCGRPPCPAPARATPASSCGPGRRRTWRRPGAGAPRARCRRSRRWRPPG
jgi:hypothetical protein